MTIYDKQGKAVAQVGKILCNGKEYAPEELHKIIKEHEAKRAYKGEV